MSLTSTYALDIPHPYLMVRGAEQTITAPIRHGSGGGLVAPTEAGSTVTIYRPNGTEFVSAAAVTVTSSTAGYTLTPTAAEALGEGWRVVWSLLFGTETVVRQSTAMLCQYLPFPVISERELYEEEPELRYRVPQAQGEKGTDEGWQPQIDAAWHAIQRKLIEQGDRPWRIIEPTDLHDILQYGVLRRACKSITTDPEGIWQDKARGYMFDERDAWARLRVQYLDQEAGTRKAASAVIRLAPVGRPAW